MYARGGGPDIGAAETPAGATFDAAPAPTRTLTKNATATTDTIPPTTKPTISGMLTGSSISSVNK